MPVANEGKTECRPYGMRPAEPVKSCDLKEAVPMIERLQLKGTGSADDAINSIAYLADISLKILDEIHTKL